MYLFLEDIEPAVDLLDLSTLFPIDWEKSTHIT